MKGCHCQRGRLLLLLGQSNVGCSAAAKVASGGHQKDVPALSDDLYDLTLSNGVIMVMLVSVKNSPFPCAVFRKNLVLFTLCFSHDMSKA